MKFDGSYIHIVGLKKTDSRMTSVYMIRYWYSCCTLLRRHSPSACSSHKGRASFDSPIFITKHQNNSAQRGDHRSNSALSPTPPLTWQSDENPNSMLHSQKSALHVPIDLIWTGISCETSPGQPFLIVKRFAFWVLYTHKTCPLLYERWNQKFVFEYL